MTGFQRKYSLFQIKVSFASFNNRRELAIDKLNWEVFELDLKLIRSRVRKGVHSSKQLGLANFQECCKWLLFYALNPPDAVYKSQLVIETVD